jgi:hypothetical protein
LLCHIWFGRCLEFKAGNGRDRWLSVGCSDALERRGGARVRPEAVASVVRSLFDREYQRSLFVDETPTASNITRGDNRWTKGEPPQMSFSRCHRETGLMGSSEKATRRSIIKFRFSQRHTFILNNPNMGFT